MDPKITYENIDWQLLWNNAREQKSWTPKGPQDWDKKAPSFAKRNATSPFVDLVLAKLPLQKSFTVLDAGCGPGTLSLPLSQHVKSVTALDYSKGMLAELNKESKRRGIKNIITLQVSWEDDWETFSIPHHDICIASRSLSVANLKDSLAKLHQHSRYATFVVDRISPTPFDRGAFAAINRPFRSGPDYIYTVNMLYSMGINCEIDIISLNAETTYKDIQQAMDSFCWMFQDLTETEEKNLLEYVKGNSKRSADGQCVVTRAVPPRWAIISWKKEQ